MTNNNSFQLATLWEVIIISGVLGAIETMNERIEIWVMKVGIGFLFELLKKVNLLGISRINPGVMNTHVYF